MNNPRLNPAVLLAPLDDCYVGYDQAKDRLFELNGTAALLTELCDGTRSVEQLAVLIGPLFSGGENSQVNDWIAEALNIELLTCTAEPTREPVELTGSQLSCLARRLQAEGKFSTAFLCQKRATELASADPQSWLAFGELAQITGKREEAQAAYERYLRFFPDDAEISHLLKALKDEEPPVRASNDCIVQLYRRFSSFYEDNLCNELDYRAPERLESLLQPVIGNRRELKILDLGCGTGLAGCRFKPSASHMVGIDLSPEMIEIARERAIYDRLEVSEISEWLNRPGERFDLILAADSLIYFGDLAPVLIPAVQRLNHDGLIAFTLEYGDRAPFKLTDSGRYSHHPDYIREISKQLPLSIVHLHEEYLRMEYSDEVTGLFVVLKSRV
jgi:predicted TPR repeat methyltransferase